MEYTKGEWKANKNIMGTWTISTDEAHIADVDRHFNANLTAATVNACISVNPNNPLAVAESIKDMYEALKDIRKFLLGVDALGPTDSQVLAAKCHLAIAQAEGE